MDRSHDNPLIASFVRVIVHGKTAIPLLCQSVEPRLFVNLSVSVFVRRFGFSERLNFKLLFHITEDEEFHTHINIPLYGNVPSFFCFFTSVRTQPHPCVNL